VFLNLAFTQRLPGVQRKIFKVPIETKNDFWIIYLGDSLYSFRDKLDFENPQKLLTFSTKYQNLLIKKIMISI